MVVYKQCFFKLKKRNVQKKRLFVPPYKWNIIRRKEGVVRSALQVVVVVVAVSESR